jgi:hypothetical protein
VFDEPFWLDAARRTFDFTVAHLQDRGRLHRVWCAGSVQRHPAVIEDYANLARAAIALFEACGEPRYLERAERWVADADEHHWDVDGAGYFVSADDTVDVVARAKSINDNAVPSGNGTMVEVLVRLYLHTGNEHYRRRAEAVIRLFSGDDPQYLISIPGLLGSAEVLMRPIQIVIVGDPGDPATRRLRKAAFAAPSYPKVLFLRDPGSPLPAAHPASGKGLVDGRPVAYVCVGQACSPPVGDAAELRQKLASL